MCESNAKLVLLMKYVQKSYHNNKDNNNSPMKKALSIELSELLRNIWSHMYKLMSHDKVYLAAICFCFDVSSLSNAISLAISLKA